MLVLASSALFSCSLILFFQKCINVSMICLHFYILCVLYYIYIILYSTCYILSCCFYQSTRILIPLSVSLISSLYFIFNCKLFFYFFYFIFLHINSSVVDSVRVCASVQASFFTKKNYK